MVLITGHRGRLGIRIARHLAEVGHAVRGFDLAESGDVRDADAVLAAARGVDAIVHIAGIAGDRAAAPAGIMAANLLGTWNVLLAAQSNSVPRVVYFSSGKALGMLERDPQYLPVDDDHPGRPSLPYALSKWLAEEMCQAFSERTGVDTYCLRPVQVFDAATYAQAGASPEWRPNAAGCWHMGVHVDVRDVATAAAAALTCRIRGHHRLLLCASDIAARRPTLELVSQWLPNVDWRGGNEYVADPYRALVDTSRARRILGWMPHHRWPGRASDVASEVLAE